jgi:hypothetical protein
LIVRHGLSIWLWLVVVVVVENLILPVLAEAEAVPVVC